MPSSGLTATSAVTVVAPAQQRGRLRVKYMTFKHWGSTTKTLSAYQDGLHSTLLGN
jgi:general stress protein 26